MTEAVLFLLGTFAGVALLLHLASIALVARRIRTRDPAAGVQVPVTVLAPVCGVEPGIERTLASFFGLAGADPQLLFCVADGNDPVIPLVKGLIARHPDRDAALLVGEDRVSGNPKLNNLVKGWAAARGEFVVMTDSNQILPPDYVAQLLGVCGEGVGLVSSPAVGIEPAGAWARIEAAFLNTHQARCQLAADSVGLWFAQGKTLAWPKAVLDRAGGPAALGRDLAEDVASTKVVRAAGLRVRLPRLPFAQPLGRRSRATVWGRQLRWARIRRAGFPLIYGAEIASGGALPMLAVLALAAAGGVPPWLAVAFPLVWYAAEWALARAAGWPSALSDVAAMIARDLLMPAIWILGWRGGISWRGTEVTAAGTDAVGQTG